MTYLLIAFAASLIGAISGLGGGVIIKPMLDLLGDFSASTISVLSAFTVFAMSAASISKHLFHKTKLNLRLGMLLSAGAIIGGYLGNYLFNYLLAFLGKPKLVTLLQNTLLVLLLIGVLIYMNFFRTKKSFSVKNTAAILVTGLFLGTLSSFLGIGGGPINVVILTLLFSMKPKDAAVNSLLLIFFSQASKLTSIALTTGFAAYTLSPLWVMIPAGIAGGLIGAHFNKKLSGKKVLLIFSLTNVFIIGIGLFNCLKILAG